MRVPRIKCILIARAISPMGGTFPGKAIMAQCAECHSCVWFAYRWLDLRSQAGSMSLCARCATELFVGTVQAQDHPDREGTVYIDRKLTPSKVELSSLTNLGSPRWITCRRCGAYKGDDCRDGNYCPVREDDAVSRVKELQTWGVSWRSPCCQRGVWLIWRTPENELEWRDVPCFACDMTYTIRFYAEDQMATRVPVDRVNPDHLIMTCWAVEESDPWTAKT